MNEKPVNAQIYDAMVDYCSQTILFNEAPARCWARHKFAGTEVLNDLTTERLRTLLIRDVLEAAGITPDLPSLRFRLNQQPYLYSRTADAEKRAQENIRSDFADPKAALAAFSVALDFDILDDEPEANLSDLLRQAQEAFYSETANRVLFKASEYDRKLQQRGLRELRKVKNETAC